MSYHNGHLLMDFNVVFLQLYLSGLSVKVIPEAR